VSASREARPPETVRHALERVLGTQVGQVKVIEHSRLIRLHGRAVATTRRRRIYLRGSAADFFANPWLMLHEYCHVIRQWEPRSLTVSRYLLECLRHGYWNNRFEVEAREFADRNVASLRALLASPTIRVPCARPPLRHPPTT
jgi:Domain of unknown function (DUF4157)